VNTEARTEARARELAASHFARQQLDHLTDLLCYAA